MTDKKDVSKEPLRVWHIPQVPMKPFRMRANNLREAKLLLTALADYDRFQFENKIKPDYCNVQGLEVFSHDPERVENAKEGEWVDWEDNEGRSIDEVMEEKS